MPKYRQLHTKIVDSFDFSEMPDDFTRVFWILLLVIVDSEGRALDNSSWLKSKMFPLREDVETKMITSAIDWLCKRKMVTRYEVDGRKYFYLDNFKTYQTGTEKEAKSTFPSPVPKIIETHKPTPELLQSSSGVDSNKVNAAVLYCIESESAIESESVCVSDDLKEVYRLYESELGLTITQAKTQELEDDLKEFGINIMRAAIKSAVDHSARNYAYFKKTAQNMKVHGIGATSNNSGNGHKKDTEYNVEMVNGELIARRKE